MRILLTENQIKKEASNLQVYMRALEYAKAHRAAITHIDGDSDNFEEIGRAHV